MPITVTRASGQNDRNHATMLRIIKDLPAQHELHSVLGQWHAKPDKFDLWFAVFNERVVGFTLVKGSDIEAIAVHSATRGRGVGHRMLTLVIQQYGAQSLKLESPQGLFKVLFDETQQ